MLRIRQIRWQQKSSVRFAYHAEDLLKRKGIYLNKSMNFSHSDFELSVSAVLLSASAFSIAAVLITNCRDLTLVFLSEVKETVPLSSPFTKSSSLEISLSASSENWSASSANSAVPFFSSAEPSASFPALSFNSETESLSLPVFV